MGRKIEHKRKYKQMTLRIISDCMREFIMDTAQSQSVCYGRQVSMSKVVNDIVRKEMIELGWECE